MLWTSAEARSFGDNHMSTAAPSFPLRVVTLETDVQDLKNADSPITLTTTTTLTPSASVPSYNGRIVVTNSTSAVAVTLSATTLAPGEHLTVIQLNTGATTVAVTGSSVTVNGGTTAYAGSGRYTKVDVYCIAAGVYIATKSAANA